MNERIRELRNRAQKFVLDIPAALEPAEFDEIFEEKFAELIVQECLNQGDKLSKHYMNTHTEREQSMLLAAVGDYSQAIKHHFGVEE